VKDDQERHIPVLADQLVSLIDPSPLTVGVDCTVGGGGHALAVLHACSGKGRVIGIDVDPEALKQARAALADFADCVTLVHGNFSSIQQILKELNIPEVGFVYADLGVSSIQLASAERGFSFSRDGPLDMRLDPDLPTRAADLVNGLKENKLADLIYRYGQEHRSKKIARLICQVRRGHRLDSTRELAEIVCRALNIDPARVSPRRIHPATKTFQALRIAVNDELGHLEKLLQQVPIILAPAGRFAVVSFHSLDDSLVKQDFRARAARGIYRILTKKPVVPDQSELIRNPRARSAKLRAVEKIS